MKKKVLPLLQLIVSALCMPLYFLPFIVGVGHHPTLTGEIVEKRYYHTPWENLSGESFQWLAYVSLALLFTSVLLSLFSIKHKGIRKASLVSTVIALLITLVTIVYSTTIARGY